MKLLTKSVLIISMLFFFSNYVSAQDTPVIRSHAISEPLPLSEQDIQAIGELDIIAIMVEFQPDSNRLTTGTGIFGPNGMDGLPFLSNEDDFRVDPLPHNQAYFETHLEFAKNYYEKSSDGQLTLNYRVLPDVYTLPNKMEAYSPTGETFTNEKVAELIRDAWQEVENGGDFDASGLDPEKTAFVIFHAGVGRDIELTGTNLDITPLDIPSLYLRKQNLASLLSEPSFQGFPVNDGTFRVTNSMVIPRTETRRGLDIQENEFAFPLSINGLLIASIGSHLGLPDLFNTETGDPGIGRFGLMDGAGFFSFNGLLPPEPSAWEKVYLGWETPFTINTNTEDEISLPASSLDQPNSIAKIPISESEYFLVENRHRDPNDNGITITIRQPDGTLVEQNFTNQDESFVFQLSGFDTLLTAGSFVDASNFDFSLPGGFDEGQNENSASDDRDLNGGILIWHIDEAVINQTLAFDRVNANSDRRGIDLEEADGSQDIGQILFGALDNSAAFGTAFDFWWSGNNYRVILPSGESTRIYDNRFGPDTRPSNESNSGGPSFFELYDFSDNLTTATFKIRPAEPFADLFTSNFTTSISEQHTYTNSDPYYDHFSLSLSMYETPNDTFLIVPSQQSVTAISLSDPENRQYTLLEDVDIQQPFIHDQLVLASKPTTGASEVDVFSFQWNDNTASFDTTWTSSLPANKGFLSSQGNGVLHADFTTDGLNLNDGSRTTLGNVPFLRSEVIGGEFSEATQNEVIFSSAPSLIYNPLNSENRLYAGAIQLGSRTVFYVFEDDQFSLVDPERSEQISPLFTEASAEWPAILDDGTILRVDKINNQIIGHNRSGATQNFTPVQAPEGIQFSGTPLYTDLLATSTEYASIILGQDSLSINLYAYQSNGEAVQGFPLYVGEAKSTQAQSIHPIIYGDQLFAVSHNGTVRSWNLSQVSDTKWSSRYGNAPFNKVSARVEELGQSQFPEFGVLNNEETYNWPNPANDETNIRFHLAEPGGTVEITVITMSGRIIFEKTVSSPGGLPQEVQVNTQNWGSGGYVARVKATVDGKTEIKLIKIGVVH